MRTDKGALVALDAVFDLPFRNIQSDAAFFKGGAPHRERAVFQALEGADRQVVAFLTVHRNQQFFNKRRQILGDGFAGAGAGNSLDIPRRISGVLPVGGNVDLHDRSHALFNRRIVHVDDLLALVAVIVDHGFLQILHCVRHRNDRRQFEERRLHDHVDAAAQAQTLGDAGAVEGVELNLVLGDIAFHEAG